MDICSSSFRLNVYNVITTKISGLTFGSIVVVQPACNCQVTCTSQTRMIGGD